MSAPHSGHMPVSSPAFCSGCWGHLPPRRCQRCLPRVVGLLAPALAGRGLEIGILVVAFLFWSLINMRGVTLGVRLNSIATIAKLFPLVLVVIGGALFIDPEKLRIDEMPPAADMARTSLLLIFAFAGIEVALVPSGEVKDTASTVPRAIALAMTGITVLYIALQVVAQGILGDGLAKATVAPLADAAGASLGEWARTLLLVGAAVSMFGYLGGMTLSMPRMLFALARDGFLPRVLAAVHPRHHSPHAAILAQSLVALVLAISGRSNGSPFSPTCRPSRSTSGAPSPPGGCEEAAGRATRPGSAFHLPTVVPWLASGVIVWLLTGLTRAEWFGFIVCLVAASLIYAATSGARARPQTGDSRK